MRLVTNPSQVDTTPVSDPVDYHLVWFGKPIDHIRLCIASLFATQANPRVTLWTTEEYVDGLREAFSFPGKAFRVEVFRSQYEGVLYVKEPYDKFWTCDDWRLDILYTHGGIYVDMDTLALKDISWVSRYRAMSRWGREERCNSSITSFPKGDPELLKLIQHMGDNRKHWDRPVPNLWWNLVDVDMTCFDVVFFDYGWTVENHCDTFFSSLPDDPNFFNGSYVYHWHNRWDRDVRNPDTLVGHYWKKYVLGSA